MKGHIILTERRSGASWLGTLTNSAGTMGNANEHLKLALRLRHPPEKHFEVVLHNSTGQNGHFGIRIAPGPVRITYRRFGYDFVKECVQRHDVKLILLERRDRLRQAISGVRASMSGAWNGSTQKIGEEVYDFEAIANEAFALEQSYAFWRSYLALTGFDHDYMAYEDLILDPAPYIKALATHHEVSAGITQSGHRIQRDEITEDWVARFRSDAMTRVVFSDLDRALSPKRSVGNFINFIAKRGVV